MNLKKLTTLLFAGVTAATPFATNAQNPTILQGNYISNVFGQANFVLNPNAQTNVANVTLTNATATRSTTTPLVATSEWNVTVTSANGTAAWATRSFDAGMKNQNCEARFSYRGFQATSKAQIKQGANVVAELTLTPSATDPRIASINFPCGDLSSATTFVITDSATLSGTHEIGGIYVGLATNQANVAQAEVVVRAGIGISTTMINNTDSPVIYDQEYLDTLGQYDPSTGIFKAKQAGVYLITATTLTNVYTWTAGKIHNLTLRHNGSTVFASDRHVINATSLAQNLMNSVTGSIPLNVGDEVEVLFFHNLGSNISLINDAKYDRLTITRFPSSSELVVTPETQNVWGATDGTGFDSTTNSATYVTPNSFSTINSNGKCQPDGTNLACKIETLPPGSYKVSVSLPYFSVAGSATQSCLIQIKDNKGAVDAPTAQSVANSGQTTGISSVSRVFKYNSTQTNVIFSLRHSQSSGTGGSCGVYTATSNRFWVMTVQPLDNASNSALYVQGPVKAAATGTAIPTGYAGEKIEASTSSIFNASSTLNVWSNITGLTITLTPGVWEIDGIVGIMQSCYSSNAGFAFSNIAIMSGGSPIQRVAIGSFGDPANTSFYPVKCLTSGGTIRTIVNVTSSTSYEVGVQVGSWSGTPVFTNVVRSDVTPSFIRAVRIN